MAFIPRIFLRSSLTPGETVCVEGADANHIRNVLRIPIGGELTVCDGAHAVFRAFVESFGDKCVYARIDEQKQDDREFPFPVTVYQCYPKGEKAETVLQKAVELGATEIVFVLSERCVARPDEKAMSKKLERLRKIAESAAAQCGRSILPEVTGLIPYAQACDRASRASLAFLCYEGGGTVPLRELVEACPDRSGGISFLIGPEGGISEKEVELAKASGLSLAGLGSRILRTETAALFVLSAINVLT